MKEKVQVDEHTSQKLINAERNKKIIEVGLNVF